jgi:hypothetical protein
MVDIYGLFRACSFEMLLNVMMVQVLTGFFITPFQVLSGLRYRRITLTNIKALLRGLSEILS